MLISKLVSLGRQSNQGAGVFEKKGHLSVYEEKTIISLASNFLQGGYYTGSLIVSIKLPGEHDTCGITWWEYLLVLGLDFLCWSGSLRS